jgi:biopolymer transport protein ExbD
MQFSTRRRRQTPTVIIVSLIDVLIVVLIFLMVTTTFKQQPALKLTLPESNQPKTGADTKPKIIVSIRKDGMLFFGSNKDPVTLAALQQRLKDAAQRNPETSVSIAADTAAPWGQVVAVRDAARDANIKNVSGQVSEPAAKR